jgi:hypothetical protein
MILFEFFNVNRVLDREETGDPYAAVASHLGREFMKQISPEDIEAIEISGTQIVDVIFKDGFKPEKTRLEFPNRIDSGVAISQNIEDSSIKINMDK